MYRKLEPILRLHRAVHTATAEDINRINSWKIHSYGGIEELRLSSSRHPIIQHPDEVAIKVKAASVNPIDNLMINGYGKNLLHIMRSALIPNFEFELPLTVGRDFCGTVINKGQNVQKYKIGDEVYGFVPLHKPGTFSEVTVTNQSCIQHKPKQLSETESASIVYASMTAYGALFVTGQLQYTQNLPNKKILILGASGGVGTVAVQLLKSQNCTVFGTCSQDAIPLLSSLGCDMAFDYLEDNYLQNVGNAAKYDIILDCAKFGINNVPKFWKFNTFITLNSPLLVNLDKYGVLSGLFQTSQDLISANLNGLREGKYVKWGFFVPSEHGFKMIDKLVKENRIKPVVHKMFSFEQLPQALEAVQAGHLRGKVVVKIE